MKKLVMPLTHAVVSLAWLFFLLCGVRAGFQLHPEFCTEVDQWLRLTLR
jgi:hypothetical protein